MFDDSFHDSQIVERDLFRAWYDTGDVFVLLST
jgi:hypothetical protein